MFFLPQGEAPRTGPELADALRLTLQEVFVMPDPRKAIAIRGSALSSLDSIRIDLSGAAVNGQHRLPCKPQPVGRLSAGPMAKAFEIVGHPILVHDSKLNMQLTAKAVQFEFGHDKSGRALLLLNTAEDGHVHVEIGRDDLERLLLAAARAAAADHNVTIQDIRMKLSQERERRNEIFAEVEVTAKKFLSATIRIAGHVEIDDALEVTLSDLACDGKGALGSMLCGFVRPHLEKANKRKYPLTALSLGDVRLHDVNVRVDSRALRIDAEFGA